MLEGQRKFQNHRNTIRSFARIALDKNKIHESESYNSEQNLATFGATLKEHTFLFIHTKGVLNNFHLVQFES